MKRKIRSMRAVSLLVSTGLLLGGCGSGGQQAAVIEQEPYEKMTYQTAEVQRGDLNPSITLTLSAEGYEQIKYNATSAELKLDKLHVSVGDRVQKGDLLVSFEAESIDLMIAGYEEQKEQNELLVEHYENLMRIDASADYTDDITNLKEDIQVARLYIEEAKSRLSDYQIVAKEAGTITEINADLRDGYYKPGATLLTEVCGTGNYSAATEDTEVFTVGETYTAEAGVASYELRLVDITEEILTFEPVSDMSSVSKTNELTLTVEKPPLTDVVYVDKAAIQSVAGEEDTQDTYFVYVMEDDGYRKAVFVTTGDQVNGYTVITQGLKGGEKVTLK